MYTITGYDASAHIAEETTRQRGGGQGRLAVGASSAVIGWFVLLAITFAATDVGAINDAAGSSISVFTSAEMNQNWAEAIILIAVVGQLFCGMAVRHELLAYVLRVLARPRNSRLAAVEPGGRQGRAGERRDRQLPGSRS